MDKSSQEILLDNQIIDSATVKAKNRLRAKRGLPAITADEIGSVEVSKKFIGISVDRSKYVNVDTGELLSSERGISIRQTVVEESLSEVTYNNFLHVNVSGLSFAAIDVSVRSLGVLFVMATFAKTEWNTVLAGNNRPIKIKTLADICKMSVPTFNSCLDELCSANLIVTRIVGGNKSGYNRVIHLNPNIVKRRKYFATELFEWFERGDMNNMDGMSDEDIGELMG